MLFTQAQNLSDKVEMSSFIPGLGDPGASAITAWGTFADNAASLKLSTVDEIEAAASGNDEKDGRFQSTRPTDKAVSQTPVVSPASSTTVSSSTVTASALPKDTDAYGSSSSAVSAVTTTSQISGAAVALVPASSVGPAASGPTGKVCK